jgi:hypothetical protein
MLRLDSHASLTRDVWQQRRFGQIRYQNSIIPARDETVTDADSIIIESSKSINEHARVNNKTVTVLKCGEPFCNRVFCVRSGNYRWLTSDDEKALFARLVGIRPAGWPV